MSNEKVIACFDHEKNITVGRGRVIWTGRDGHYLEPGWALPGGRRTNDEFLARLVAQRIDANARGKSW